MKRAISVVLALVLCISLFACSGNGNTSSQTPVSSAPASSAPESSEAVSSEPVSSEPVSSEPVSSAPELESVRIGALKGPTAMGMVKMMDDVKDDDFFQFTIAASADEITPKLVQGELDVAAVPANLASVLYNNTQGQIQVLAVNTLGVLYIVERGDTVHSVEDLRGKTIYSSGKGSTPEYALEYMLSQNGIDPEKDVTIEWKSEHSECVAALAAQEGAIAMLPQPFVTTAQVKDESIRVALDLTEEWEKLSSEESPATLITGVVVARKAFVEEQKDWVDSFLTEYDASVEFVNSNVDEAAKLVGQFDIVPEAVAKKALPECNITFIAGEDLHTQLSSYLQTLFDQNPKAVGGALPGDDFYYAK